MLARLSFLISIVGYDIYMAGMIALYKSGEAFWLRIRNCSGILSLILQVIICAIRAQRNDNDNDNDSSSDLGQILEWSNMLVILAFFYANVKVVTDASLVLTGEAATEETEKGVSAKSAGESLKQPLMSNAKMTRVNPMMPRNELVN